MKVLGTDEAGRGPVIGPLIIVGITMQAEDLPKLETINIKDSKLLTKSQREAVFNKILELAESYKIVHISPEEIDQTIDHNETLNLNLLEAIKTADIINELKPDKAILDCPSNNIQAYQNYLKSKLINQSIEIIAEHKADTNHKIVAAASIIAKVTRDKEIEKIQKAIPCPIGSGYPSDPRTQKFLKENYHIYPHIFRKSWQSYKNVTSEKKQTNLADFS